VTHSSNEAVSGITWKHVKVAPAIVRCRTAALVAISMNALAAGNRAISFNSCRNRHCPQCQAAARERWLEKTSSELLPTPYSACRLHPSSKLAPLALQNKKGRLHLLFRTSAETLLEVARDPKHLGARNRFLSVLLPGVKNSNSHPHVLCVVRLVTICRSDALDQATL